MASGTVAQFEATIRALKQGHVAPIYCLHGPERWMKQRLAEAIRQAVLPGKTASLNHDRLSAVSHEPQQVIDCLATMPMLGKRRLVEVADADRWNAKQMAELIPVLDAFPPSACLLLLADKLDGRLKAVKRMAKLGVVLKLEEPSIREMAPLLERLTTAKGLRLEGSATAMLLELVGRNIGSAVAALDNASLYVGERKTITVDDVKAVVPDVRQAIIFELTDAVGAADIDAAFDALRRLGVDRNEAPRVLAMLVRQVRLLWMARSALDGGISPQALANELDVHPFVARQLASQVRNYEAASLQAAHKAAVTADLALKGSRQAPRFVLERLVLDLCLSGKRSIIR
ncbi:MAG: DNA polymerase III subunit delta [Deltaproteobacteria bacterium]|nr:DNA polymerase III subunit delta [Deltaproteobacteria bacterium]